MDDELDDELFDGIMKTFLAQLNSSLEISKIISEHNSEEEISGDSIIGGLVYRLMTPMKNEEVTESLDIASDIYDKLLYSESESESDSESEDIIETASTELTLRKVRTNNCNCEICIQTRVCLLNYNNHEPKDHLELMYKNAIKDACGKGLLYI